MGYIKNRIYAIRFAVSGIYSAFRKETHLKLMLLTAIMVVFFGTYAGIGKTEWILVLACITLVICLEMFNSAIEKLCNQLHPEKDPNIKYIKDVCAGAVLIACLFSIATGLIIFIPYVNRLLGS
jgi:diacylglycerol kinase